MRDVKVETEGRWEELDLWTGIHDYTTSAVLPQFR